jgi:protease-4
MNNEPNIPHPASPNPTPPQSVPSPQSGLETGSQNPAAPPRTAVPVAGGYDPSRVIPPRRPDVKNTPMFGCLFAVSVILNFGAVLVLLLVCCVGFYNWRMGAPGPDSPLNEKVISGNESAKEKVAIIQLDGVIMEGSLNFVHKQIEQAGKDKQVKAIVLRINSPGGSITASDDLHRKLTDLTTGKKNDKKPLVVSMGSMAASGGYYVAMPGQVIFAEKTTMTGSIGVYAAFPNVAKLGEKYGFAMEVIKAGDIKDSGSPFKEMKPIEKQVWQDMINDAYNQFLDVVVDGRKDQLTREDLLNKFDVTPVKIGDKVEQPYKRNLADGGIWTANKAKELKLIDRIGTLDDAIQEAHDRANMSGDYKAVQYEKPRFSLLEVLMNIRSEKPAGLNSPLLDPSRLRNGLTPRVWYLAPGCEFAGMLAVVEAE